MLDPFSLVGSVPVPPFIGRIADILSLAALPLHAHEVCLALAFYSFVAHVVSPFISSRLFPNKYPKFDRRTRIGWDVHVVSFVQSCMINALSLYVILFEEERKAWRAAKDWEKRIWGYTGLTGLTQSMALGYFLWDFYVCVWYVDIFGWGMLAHAIASCAMFVLGFRPFVYFYCPVFLLHQLSTPFLNIHWFLDKLGLTGSTYQAINGAFLTITFFCCRLVWGAYGSINVSSDVLRAIRAGHTTPQYFDNAKANAPTTGDLGDPLGQTTAFMKVRYLPLWLGMSYLASNTVLALLNFFWFFKMIETIRKRFDPPFGTKEKRDDNVRYNSSHSEKNKEKVK